MPVPLFLRDGRRFEVRGFRIFELRPSAFSLYPLPPFFQLRQFHIHHSSFPIPFPASPLTPNPLPLTRSASPLTPFIPLPLTLHPSRLTSRPFRALPLLPTDHLQLTTYPLHPFIPDRLTFRSGAVVSMELGSLGSSTPTIKWPPLHAISTPIDGISCPPIGNSMHLCTITSQEDEMASS